MCVSEESGLSLLGGVNGHWGAGFVTDGVSTMLDAKRRPDGTEVRVAIISCHKFGFTILHVFLISPGHGHAAYGLDIDVLGHVYLDDVPIRVVKPYVGWGESLWSPILIPMNAVVGDIL